MSRIGGVFGGRTRNLELAIGSKFVPAPPVTSMNSTLKPESQPLLVSRQETVNQTDSFCPHQGLAAVDLRLIEPRDFNMEVSVAKPFPLETFYWHVYLFSNCICL